MQAFCCCLAVSIWKLYFYKKRSSHSFVFLLSTGKDCILGRAQLNKTIYNITNKTESFLLNHSNCFVEKVRICRHFIWIPNPIQMSKFLLTNILYLRMPRTIADKYKLGLLYISKLSLSHKCKIANAFAIAKTSCFKLNYFLKVKSRSFGRFQVICLLWVKLKKLVSCLESTCILTVLLNQSKLDSSLLLMRKTCSSNMLIQLPELSEQTESYWSLSTEESLLAWPQA